MLQNCIQMYNLASMPMSHFLTLLLVRVLQMSIPQMPRFLFHWLAGPLGSSCSRNNRWCPEEGQAWQCRYWDDLPLVQPLM